MCWVRRRMWLARGRRFGFKPLYSATQYCHMISHSLKVGGPMTNVTNPSSHQLESIILIARLHRFARTSRTLCSIDTNLLHKSHRTPMALLHIPAQLIDDIAHSPQLLILPLQLTLELVAQTAFYLPNNVSRLHLSTGLCGQSTGILRGLCL